MQLLYCTKADDACMTLAVDELYLATIGIRVSSVMHLSQGTETMMRAQVHVHLYFPNNKQACSLYPATAYGCITVYKDFAYMYPHDQ